MRVLVVALALTSMASDPPVAGRSRAPGSPIGELFSDRLMAERVLTAHRWLLQPIEASATLPAGGDGDRGGDLA